jgi:hypothetical protein
MCEVVHVPIGNQLLKQWTQQWVHLCSFWCNIHFNKWMPSASMGCEHMQWRRLASNKWGSFNWIWSVVENIANCSGNIRIKLWTMLLFLSCNTNGDKILDEPWTFFQKNVGKGMFQCTYMTNLASHNLVMEIMQNSYVSCINIVDWKHVWHMGFIGRCRIHVTFIHS